MSHPFFNQSEENFREVWLIVVYKILARTDSYFKVCHKFFFFQIGIVNSAYFFAESLLTTTCVNLV